MCRSHYRKWLAAFPEARIATQTRAAVLALLPATQQKIIGDTGFAPQTVKRTLDALRAESAIHVGDFDPPTARGLKFVPVYVYGPGEDAVLTKKMQRDQRRKTVRKCHERRQQKKQAAAIPPASRWAAALLMGTGNA